VKGEERIFASRVQSIHKCAAQDNVDGIMYFCKNLNVDPNKLDDFGDTALCKAAHHGSMHAIDELVFFEADVDFVSAKGWTGVHYASNSGHASVVKQLYDHGANTLIQDMGGFTAAHLSAQCNQVECLKTLFLCQPNLPLTCNCLSIKSMTGATPAHVAAQFDCLEALKFLSRCGCDMECLDKNGETPAHKAARNNSQLCYKMLDEQIGVDVNLENNDGDTPADLLLQCTRHNQASKDESGTTQVYVQRLVKAEQIVSDSQYFRSNTEAEGKKLEFVGTSRRNQTPAEMRAHANKFKMTDGSQFKEKKPPPPPGFPPKFQQRHGRLEFAYER
jgi:ankyrin repeat protein